MSKEEWEHKLKGKQYVEVEANCQGSDKFTKKDLPQDHRIVLPGAMLTRDYRTDRLNVHVDDKGVCKSCSMG